MRSSGLCCLRSGFGLFFCATLAVLAAPSPGAADVTKLLYQSSPGDIVGEGVSRQYFSSDGDFEVTFVPGNGIHFTFVGQEESWTIDFEAPDGRFLVVGPYENATDFRFHSPTKSGIRATVNGRECERAVGRFDLRELEFFHGAIVSFAVDLEQRCEGSNDPLYIEARYSASSSFPRPPDQDFDGVPDSMDNCVTNRNPFQADDDFDLRGDACDSSFNNTFFSATSAKGDPLGLGESFIVRRMDGVFTAMHQNETHLVLGIDGDDDWTFEFGAPEGQTLEVGTYNGALPPDAQGPELLVSHSRRACPNPSGLFEIHEVVFNGDGTIGKLAVDFVQSCDGAPPLTGSLRYNASDFIMIRPKPDTVLTSATVTFEWSDNVSAKTEFFLDVGTKKGFDDILDTDSLGRVTSYQVSNLPTDGSPIWLRLWVRTIMGLRFADFRYTSVLYNFIPTIVEPVPSSVLPGGSARFEWVANGLDVSNWRLQLGTQFGSANLFDSGGIKTTYVDVTGLPTDGSTVYARLWFVSGGAWDLEDFVYTADPTGGTPELISPEPGSILAGSDVTFEWEPKGSIVTQWLLYFGTAPGNWDLLKSSGMPGGTTTLDVSGLPTDGSTVYVRLWYVTGSWKFKDYQYQTPDFGGKPALVSPSDGSQLAGADVDFRWDRNGSVVSTWRLMVGSTPGAHDLYDSGALDGSAGGAAVTGLPTDGSTLYARLWFVAGQWQYADSQFTAADIGGAPVMVSPAPGGTLSGQDVVFEWSPGGSVVTYWKLFVGSTPGGYDFVKTNGLDGQTTSLAATNLPSDGSALYVRLWYVAGGSWKYNDYSYVTSSAGGLPSFVSPKPFAILQSTSVDFSWAENGSRVRSWRFMLGVTLGGRELFDSGTVTSTQVNVTGLPEDGTRLFATLIYSTGAGYFTIEAQYSASSAGGKPSLTSPAPNTVLPGDTATFTWTAAGTVVKSWWLNIGAAPGTNEIFNSGLLAPTTTSVTVPGLPTDGSQIWVQLWYQKQDNTWTRVDTWYSAAGP